MAAMVLCRPAAATDLVVEISGIAPTVGAVHVALYDQAEAFPGNDGMLASRIVRVRKNTVRVVFSGLAGGRYAVAAYHDADGDGSFDQGLLGIPLEGYGFSGGAQARFGAPSFAAAAVLLEADGAVAKIAMTYW